MIVRVFQTSAWLVLAAIIFVTTSPIDLRPHDVLPVDFDRAAAFAVMATFFVLAYPRHWFIVGLAVVMGAGGIELLQELSPSRHAQVADALVKAAGASLGVLSGWAINNLLDRYFASRLRR